MTLLGVLSAVALWFICRPYIGVDGDARLYVGRVLADLDPHGVGLDLAFAHDGQSRFSIFPRLITPIVAAMGVGPGAMAVTAAGLVLWFAAAALLLSRFFRGRMLWAALVCVAAFPPDYGGFSMFAWGEALATPRIFAEALALAALAMLVDGRRLAAFALALAGAAFHPIMVIPAVAAALVFEGLEDRRWFLLAPIGAAALAAGALFHLPVADRLFAPIDPAWLKIVATRNPQVLLALWPANSWAPAACDAAALVLAWSLADARLRRLLLAVAVVAIGAAIVAAVAPTRLIAQLQLWRALWLASFFAAAAFAPTASALWRGGGASRAALAMLAIAWVGSESLPVAAIAGLAAVILGLGLAPRPFPGRWVWTAFAMAAVFILVTLIGHAALVAKAYAPLPADYRFSPTNWLRVGAQTVIFGAAALAVTLAPPQWHRAPGRILAAVSTLLLVLVAILCWDDEPGVTRARVADAGGARLRAMLGGGSVYWLDSSGTNWLWTRRPEWWTQTQGAGVVFDRDLAVIWSRRLDRLIALGLQRPADRRIYQARRRLDPLVTPGALEALCREPDGPRWIIAPVQRIQPPALVEAAGRWLAPVAEYQPQARGAPFIAARDYAVFDCGLLALSRNTGDGLPGSPGGAPSAPATGQDRE